jgi:hypothetical protein
VKSFAVDHHSLILIQIRRRWQIIILIALVSLQCSEFHAIKAAFHDFAFQRLVLCACQQHMDVGPVRSREIRKPQILFPIRGLVYCRPPARLMNLSFQLCCVQGFRLRTQRHRRCFVHLLFDEQLLRPERPPRYRKYRNTYQDDNPFVA